jgi:hypothetical protein
VLIGGKKIRDVCLIACYLSPKAERKQFLNACKGKSFFSEKYIFDEKNK